jgi:hypothetical protein
MTSPYQLKTSLNKPKIEVIICGNKNLQTQSSEQAEFHTGLGIALRDLNKGLLGEPFN